VRIRFSDFASAMPIDESRRSETENWPAQVKACVKSLLRRLGAEGAPALSIYAENVRLGVLVTNANAFTLKIGQAG
jgi:hypothetical protein